MELKRDIYEKLLEMCIRDRARTGDKGTGGSDFQRSAFPCWIGLEGDSETGSYRGWTFYFWLQSECER